jgi:hypothetical protein
LTKQTSAFPSCSFLPTPLPARTGGEDTDAGPTEATLSAFVTLPALWAAYPGSNIQTAGTLAAVVVTRAASVSTRCFFAWSGTVPAAEEVARAEATTVDWVTRVAVHSWSYTRLVLDSDDLAIVEFNEHCTTGGEGDEPQDQSREGDEPQDQSREGYKCIRLL